jgi:hypothetical protein
VAPLLDLLINARPRYHQLLAGALEPVVAEIVAERSTKPHQVTSAELAAELSGSLGLPLVVGEGAGLGPLPPFLAPFSEMVPKLLYIIRK